MKSAVKRMQNFFVSFLGIDRLTSGFLSFAKAHLFFTIAMNIHTVFVNILLLRSADDVNITIIYNIFLYIFTAVGMVSAGALVKKVNLKAITLTGISLYVCAYALFLIFMNNIISIYLIIAMLLGSGCGFFFLTYFNLISLYSDDESRDVSIAFIGVVTSFIALVVPSIAGAVMGAFVDFTGYHIMFICAFLVAIVSMYLFIKLPRVELVKGKSHYRRCLHSVFTNACWRSGCLQIIIRSIREGIFLFFLNVLLYQYIPNEAIIGLNALLCGFIGIFAQFYAGRYVKPQNRTKVMTVATTVLLGTCSLLFLGLNGASVLMLSLVNAFFLILLMNPALSIDFLVISSMPDGFKYRSEFFALFEVCRNIGRVIGISLIVIFPKTPIGYVSAMVIVTAIQYLTVYFSKRVENNVKRYLADNAVSSDNED